MTNMIEMLLGKGRITAWLVLVGLFIMSYNDVFDSTQTLSLIGIIVIGAIRMESAK